MSDNFRAAAAVDRQFKVAETDPRLFGPFIEHLDRGVHGGIYESGQPVGVEAGFRTDMLDSVRGLQVGVVHYPRGNFVSGYYWEDGVGPVEGRPRRRELTWKSIEPNLVGINEFVRSARRARTEVNQSLILGTRGPDMKATNTPEPPNSVSPRNSAKAEISNNRLFARLFPASWNVISMLDGKS